MQPRVGQTLVSPVDGTTVIVTRAPGREVVVTCAGVEMHDPAQPVSGKAGTAQEPTAGDSAGTLLGKRYVDEDAGIELLCTKPGDGSLAVDGQALTIKAAKPLPSSD